LNIVLVPGVFAVRQSMSITRAHCAAGDGAAVEENPSMYVKLAVAV